MFFKKFKFEKKNLPIKNDFLKHSIIFVYTFLVLYFQDVRVVDNKMLVRKYSVNDVLH